MIIAINSPDPILGKIKFLHDERIMHEFRCGCGSSIVVDSPSSNAGYLVWDDEVDACISKRRAAFQGFLAAIQSGQRDAWMRFFYGSQFQDRLRLKTDVDVLEDILSQPDSHTHYCYRCEQCGRLYVQRKPGTDEYDVLSLDES